MAALRPENGSDYFAHAGNAPRGERHAAEYSGGNRGSGAHALEFKSPLKKRVQRSSILAVTSKRKKLLRETSPMLSLIRLDIAHTSREANLFFARNCAASRDPRNRRRANA